MRGGRANIQNGRTAQNALQNLLIYSPIHGNAHTFDAIEWSMIPLVSGDFLPSGSSYTCHQVEFIKKERKNPQRK